MREKAAHLDTQMITFMFMQAKAILCPQKFTNSQDYQPRAATTEHGALGQNGFLITELLTRGTFKRVR
jgi:hypothetical protein